MPQLVKGGKWVFGWVIVGPAGQVQIPPAAYTEYGFQRGEPTVLLRGSRVSGGFGIARREKLEGLQIPLIRRSIRAGVVGENGQIVIPAGIGLKSNDRLLAVRGSGLALGFVRYGPIYEEALKHPELETFKAV
jgi:hypothetical protein